MVRSLQNLQSELNELTQQTTILARDLYGQYALYYRLLGESAKKQFILAAYQVCTQIYPDLFLKLPLGQRETLQAHLRQLSQKIAPLLQASLEPSQALSSDEAPPHESSPASSHSPLAHLTTPDQLLLWCKQREEEITRVLDQISQEANRLLQQFQVIPRQLPPKLLEIALKNEDNGSLSGQSPNILDLLLEANEDSPEDDRLSGQAHPITKVTAIHLRRSEIEFNDAQLAHTAKQTHQLLEKLSQFRQRYQRNQRENAIATAESAWRSSWHEEE
jgi:hypothetical protein